MSDNYLAMGEGDTADLARSIRIARQTQTAARGKGFLMHVGYRLPDGRLNPDYDLPRVPLSERRDVDNIRTCPEVFRASGLAVCEGCGKLYLQHPQPFSASCPTVVVSCDGRYLKL